MKKISKKLLLSVFSLLLMATVLGTSTYAWFTIGDKVTIREFEMNVQGGIGLEVAYLPEDQVGSPNYATLQFVNTLKTEDLLGFLAADYSFADEFAEKFKMADVTSADGKTFKQLTEKEGGIAVYELPNTTIEKEDGYIEFSLIFRTDKSQSASLNWINATLNSNGKDNWIPGLAFDLGDGTEVDQETDNMTYYASYAARISVTGNLSTNNTHVFEHADEYEEVESAGYANTNLEEKGLQWDKGNLYYFEESVGTIEVDEEYKTAETFSDFEDGIKVATFEPSAGTYSYATVTIRVYIEGFDADAFDGVLDDLLKVSLAFQLELPSQEGEGD